MIPISDNKFTTLPTNKDILFFEVKNSTMVRAFASSIDKEEEVVLVKLLKKSKQNNKDFEAFQDKLIQDNKTVIRVEE